MNDELQALDEQLLRLLGWDWIEMPWIRTSWNMEYGGFMRETRPDLTTTVFWDKSRPGPWPDDIMALVEFRNGWINIGAPSPTHDLHAVARFEALIAERGLHENYIDELIAELGLEERCAMYPSALEGNAWQGNIPQDVFALVTAPAEKRARAATRTLCK